jgi:SAM-dependent methyltransferase
MTETSNVGTETSKVSTSSLYFKYKGEDYLDIQRKGFASQFCFPFAKAVCKGKGLDVGCMKKEWALEGALPIDLSFNDRYDAMNLPMNVNAITGKWDYIFSSHVLEHIPDWVGVLDYWLENVKKGGVIFLYLPDYSQEYWRPFNNRKHVNILTPQYLKDYFEARGVEKVFVSGVDLYNSFTVLAIK